MGLYMELEFEKYCTLGGSPKTVLSSLHHSKVKKQSFEGNPPCGNNRLSLEEDFIEFNFHCSRSSSCNDIPSRSSGDELLKRGSVSQSSRKLRNSRTVAVEGGRSCAITFSLGVLDSSCSSDEDRSFIDLNRSSIMSPSSDSSSNSVPMPQTEEFSDLSSHQDMDNVLSSDGLSEIPLSSTSRECHSVEKVEMENVKEPKFRCDPNVGPIDTSNGLQERGTVLTLHKSLSAKLAQPHSPSPSESDGSRPSSPKARFGPIRKMFDPFTKSKYQQRPLGSAHESGRLPPGWPSNIGRNNKLQKSLLNDFSKTSQSPEFGSESVKRDLSNSAFSRSPTHLHGFLKLENKHGVPFFEFSLKVPEDVLVARIWKTETALNWVYTFHNRRKGNASRWILKDSNKESSMVAQMQVSCYLCTELKDAGAFDNSMVTEFVSYDVAHARQSITAQGNPNRPPDVIKPPKVSSQRSVGGAGELDEVPDELMLKLQPEHVTDNGHSDKSTSHPWAPADLHPGLEIAAIVIQLPFEKRGSSRYMGGDATSDQTHPNLLDVPASPAIEQRKEGISDGSSCTKVNVVTPSGSHGLPSTKSHSPSPLLDRWRLGGGCDCGSWDMGCPLTVFGNPNIQSSGDHLVMENQQPLELFLLGAKEKAPALTMTVIEEGRYSVDFHAGLSALQAFSICVAILHCTEASVAMRQERGKQLLQCNSLRVFIEEEVKSFVSGGVTEDEKREVSKKMGEIQPSFKLNPPFSPVSRV